MTTAMLEHWDTPPDEAKQIRENLQKIAKGQTQAGEQTEVSAAKALMEMAYRLAVLEQNERLKAKEAGDAESHPIASQLRALFEK